MCTPYQWQLRVTLQYEMLKQRTGAASALSHHYQCGAARVATLHSPTYVGTVLSSAREAGSHHTFGCGASELHHDRFTECTKRLFTNQIA